jgi:SAM-dependent methyltransferase
MTPPPCRFCKQPLRDAFVDLGMSPLSNAYLSQGDLVKYEAFYPLHALLCRSCFLVQLLEYESPAELFEDYAYFSSYATSWLAHCKAYTEEMVARLGLGPQHRVVEIASNDGYLLQYFQEKKIPVLGIEPAKNVAAVAREKGIPTRTEFFGVETATQLVEERYQADLLLGNNVLAHVPDLNDFVGGMKILLKGKGTITMEFPHLLRLMRENQFDTIYHEHFSYLSLHTVRNVFKAHGLRIFDTQELSTHGGSLRIFACHEGENAKQETQRLFALLAKEEKGGLLRVETYTAFSKQVEKTKRALVKHLLEMKEAGQTVVGYGAAAKGNTLLNCCGISSDLVQYVVDKSPHKQGKFLPGTHLPIYAPDKIEETKPDYVLILPWNLKDEIMKELAFIKSWGGRFIVPIPEPRVVSP